MDFYCFVVVVFWNDMVSPVVLCVRACVRACVCVCVCVVSLWFCSVLFVYCYYWSPRLADKETITCVSKSLKC